MPVGLIEIPGYVTGAWTIDPAHSDVGFVIRHLMISNVKGHFTKFEGQIVTAEDPLKSEVTATIDMTSIDTANATRDEHLRTADFFEVEEYPTMSYRSAGIRADGDGFLVEGALTLKGVTLPVPLKLEINGFGFDPFAPTRPSAPAPGSPPPARSTGWTSASATTAPSPAAACCSGRRSRSSWRSRPSCRQRARAP